MRVFNKDKSIELKEYDLDLGYLINDEIKTHYDAKIIHHDAEIIHHKAEIIHHDVVEGIKEQGHYEVIAEYPNGGKDVEWIIDIPKVEAKEAYDEIIKEAYDEIIKEAYDEIIKEAYDDIENIQIYIPYTEEELLQIKISKLKKELDNTDYQAIKYAEGWFTDEEYASIKAYRESIREKIRELEIQKQ